MIKDEWSPRTEDSLTRTCGQPKLYNRHNHSGLRKRVVCVRNSLRNLLSPIIFLTTSHYGLVRKNCPVLLSIGQARPCLTFCNLATFLLFNPVYLNTQVKVRPNPPCMSPEPWTDVATVLHLKVGASALLEPSRTHAGLGGSDGGQPANARSAKPDSPTGQVGRPKSYNALNCSIG